MKPFFKEVHGYRARCPAQDIVTASPNFNIGAFVPALKECLTVMNPFKRQFLISWITVLDSVPESDLLLYLPDLLDGLFAMLSDPNRELKQAVHKALQVCLYPTSNMP